MPDVLPVSVVIPAYNAAAYVLEALESVGAQTQKPREVIVVDDGSSDATGAFAQRWGARVIAQDNRGLASARNAGIAAAVEPWIAFLDADDRWEPRRLQAQWSLSQEAPQARLIASDYRLFGPEPELGEPVLAQLASYRAMRRMPLRGGSFVPREELLRAILEGNFVLPSSWLVDRRAFSEDELWFCPRDEMPAGSDFHIGEDYEWLLRVLRSTDALFVDEPLVAYRRSAASLSASGGRSRYGDVKLGEMVCAAPERYVAGAAAAFERLRPRQLREAALRFLAAGDVVRARRVLHDEKHFAGQPRSLALFAASAPFASRTGLAVFDRLYAAWRKGLRPVLRALRRSG